MKVLVTGGAGFIGSHIVEHFHNRAEVRVLDNLRTGYKSNLRGLRCQLFEGSILDRDLVRNAVAGVDYVFHLAAMVSVPESVLNPVECAEINSLGTLILLEEASRAGVSKLVFSSSAAIYGENPVSPKTETLPPDPRSPYAATKLEGELHCKRFADEGRLKTASLRYFNVFGPRQDPASPYAAAVPIFIRRALTNKTLTIFGNGGQTRDFIYVKDVVAANAFFATQSPETGVFNVAHGEGMTVNHLAATIRKLTGSGASVGYAPERPGDIRHSIADVAKLRRAGFTAATPFAEGLRATIDFFREVEG